MSVKLYIYLSYLIPLILVIATSFNISTLLILSTILLLGLNCIMGVYLLLCLVSLYGVLARPFEIANSMEVDEKEINQSLEILNNPFKIKPHNAGLYSIFAISFAHWGTIIFSLSIVMATLYTLLILINKFITEKVKDLTLGE